MSDTYFYYGALGLHFDGADASTTFTDSSYTPKTMTRVGVPTISTARSKYGGASGLFNGTDQALTTPHHADLNLATGDFTIEGFVYSTSLANARTILQKDQSAGTTYVSYGLQVTAAGALACSVGTGNAATYSQTISSANGLILVNTWYHIAFTRQGTTLRAFIDGALVQSATQTGTPADGAKVLTIGRYPNGGGAADSWWAGNIDDLRITKGIARYTAAFTAPTEAFPDTGVIELAQLYATIPSVTTEIYTGPQIDATLPMVQASIYTGAVLDVTLPALTFQTHAGAALDVTLPMLQARFVAHDSTGENAIDVTLPSLTFEAFGGANLSATLPSLEFDGALTITGFATLDVTLPALQFDGSGTTSGTVQINATLPMIDFVGYGGAVLGVTLGAVQAEIAVTAGAVGQIIATLPMFDVEIEATADAYGSIDAIIPALQSGPYLQMWATIPMVQFTAVGTATVTATYEAYALNLNHKGFKDPVDELTRYTNFPFTHILRYRNSYFGVAGDGLYLLEGTTDYAPATPTVPTAIPWAFKTGMDDFGTPNKKTIPAAYFRGRMGPAVTVTLYPGEASSTAYSYTTTRGTDAQNYRQKFGLGIKTAYAAIGAAGDGELALDEIELPIATLSRRI